MSRAFKIIVLACRDKEWSVRRIARHLGVPVDKVHEKCSCINGRNCTGSGCRIK